jgi:hypothetical protein
MPGCDATDDQWFKGLPGWFLLPFREKQYHPWNVVTAGYESSVNSLNEI